MPTKGGKTMIIPDLQEWSGCLGRSKTHGLFSTVWEVPSVFDPDGFPRPASH
jgi:hypothetical protein